MPKHRRGRINDAVAQELAIALRDVADPRIAGNFVSITRAEVSPDLRNATVYFSVMGDAREAQNGLRSACGLLRRHLAMTLNLRLTPELNFRADGSIEHGARIAELLHDIERDNAARNNDSEGGEHAAREDGDADHAGDEEQPQ